MNKRRFMYVLLVGRSFRGNLDLVCYKKLTLAKIEWDFIEQSLSLMARSYKIPADLN